MRPHRRQSGHATTFALLSIIPIVCLAFFIAAGAEALRGSVTAQNAADSAAIGASNVWARGLNRIEQNNAEVGVLGGVIVVARAVPRAWSDARLAAEACAPVNPTCAALASIAASGEPAIQVFWTMVEASASRGIARRALENAAVLRRLPELTAEAARQLARENGASSAALVAVTPAGATTPPSYPLRAAPLGSMCDAFAHGSPTGAPPATRRVFAAVWKWPRGLGTVAYARARLHADDVMIPLAPVGAPFFLEQRLDEALDELCSDPRPGPALFDGTLDPDAESVSERLQLVVVVGRSLAIPYQAARPRGGGDTFDRTHTHQTAIAQVQLVTSASADGTSASWDVRLVRGSHFVEALELVAAGAAGVTPELQAAARRALAERNEIRGAEFLH